LVIVFQLVCKVYKWAKWESVSGNERRGGAHEKMRREKAEKRRSGEREARGRRGER
jgi:hypothetical protein